MRLDYRITYLLSIYKKEFGDQTLDTSASVAEVPVMAGESFMTYSNINSFPATPCSWLVYFWFQRYVCVYVLILLWYVPEPNIEEIAEKKAENMFSGRWGNDFLQCVCFFFSVWCINMIGLWYLNHYQHRYCLFLNGLNINQTVDTVILWNLVKIWNNCLF